MADNWLENLKAGDEVIVGGRSDSPLYLHICLVVKVTRTQIKVDKNGTVKAFRRDVGREVGYTSISAQYLREATPEAKQEILDRKRQHQEENERAQAKREAAQQAGEAKAIALASALTEKGFQVERHDSRVFLTFEGTEFVIELNEN